MNVEQRMLGHVTVLDIEGRMTIQAPDRLVCVIVRRLLGERRRHFLLNLDRVPYVDSTGLTEIVEAYLTTTRQGGTLKLEHLSPHVRELLRITGLSSVLEAFDSEAVALASFGEPVA